jgi:prepilin-type N-terminal cleavage/methylation domain-containing protein
MGKKQSGGFTLIELLVVVAVLALLMGILMPALQKVRRSGWRTFCANNEREWGISLHMYAADNDGYFPDNMKGLDISWLGPGMLSFWKHYLVEYKKTKDPKKREHVLFCPTDKWHRLAEQWSMSDGKTLVLTGYFYLPHRDVDNGWDYGCNGIEGWHSRKKFGGRYSLAPVMGDRLQGLGTWSPSGNDGTVKWEATDGESGETVLSSTHGKPGNGEPEGGNFLFEDGRVEWHNWDRRDARATIDLGSKGGSWLCFYKLPGISTDGAGGRQG